MLQCCNASILPKANDFINLISSRPEKRYNNACLESPGEDEGVEAGGVFAAIFCHSFDLHLAFIRPSLSRHSSHTDALSRSPEGRDQSTRHSPIPMKLHANATKQYQTVTAYDESGVDINAEHFAMSLIVMPEMAPRDWPVSTFDALTELHFEQILADAPDVVILGTGSRQRFVHPRLTAQLTMRRIGVECMDNKAACRTYNILMGEGRKVTLALIIDTASAGSAI
jgi:uncharacterized protein